MKKIISLVVIAAIAVGAYFLLRHRVLWLDSFTGVIEERVEDEVATSRTDGVGQKQSYYFFEVLTDDERQVRVEVDQLQYFRARSGMRVAKRPFTGAIELIE
jgi:uncharacterized protein YxeA